MSKMQLLSKKTIAGETVVITGASKGIGWALYKRLSALGYRVIGIARNPKEGQDVHRCDVNDTNALLQLLHTLGVEHIDVLVHNAAIGFYGQLRNQDVGSIENVFNTNIVAPILITHTLFPLLSAAVQASGKSTKVIFISSSHAGVATPEFAVYTSCKAALNGFCRSLRREWHSEGIVIQNVCVGPTRTTLHESIGMTITASQAQLFMSEEYVAKCIANCVCNRRNSTEYIGFISKGLVVKSWLRSIGRLIASSSIFNWKRKRPKNGTGYVLVTGAAGGIGSAYVQLLGERVVASDLPSMQNELQNNDTNEEKINIAMDMTDIESIVKAAERMPNLDGVVMNAGMNVVGHFYDIPKEKHEQILRVNLLGPMALTSQLMALGKISEETWCLFMSSLSFFVGYPGASSYAAAKDGIASFADSIGGTVVFPGPTNTEMASSCSPDTSHQKERMSPVTVAKEALRNAWSGSAFCVPGVQNSLIALLGQLCPSILDKLMKKIIFDKLTPGQLLQIKQIQHDEQIVTRV